MRRTCHLRKLARWLAPGPHVTLRAMATAAKHRPSNWSSLNALAYGPRLAQMVITRRCNIDCGYCNEYDKTSPPVPKETVMAWVDKLASLSTLFVEFTGGETLLHPDLFELVAYASQYKFRERWIITNGFLLSKEAITSLNDAGLTHLQISIDGVAPNATTVKVLKTLRRKLELLAEHATFKVQVNSVLGAGNDAEAVEVAKTAAALGFRPRVLIVHDGDGAMSLDAEKKKLLREVAGAVGGKWNESGDYRTRLMQEGRADFHCRAGSRYLYIDEFGLVNWCSQQRGVFTKPLLEYTWADLREQFYTQKDCAPTCTVGCARTASRFDNWRAQPLRTAVPYTAPAANEDALFPIASLKRPKAAPVKRSQSAMRKRAAAASAVRNQPAGESHD